MGEQDHAPPTRADAVLACDLAPLGIPTRIVADSSTLLAAIEAAVDDQATATSANPRLVLRFSTHAIGPCAMSDRIRVEGSRLSLAGRGYAGAADAARHYGWAAVSPAIGADPRRLAEQVVDPLLLFLLTRSGRTPIHAAGIVVGATALLLVGPSGTGKSCLAMAAAQRGLPVLSDDTVFVQTEPALRIWGWRRPIHLFPADAPPGNHPVRLRSGKHKAAVPLAGSVPLPAADARLVLIEPGERVVLRPASPAEIRRAFSRLEAGFDLLGAETRTAVTHPAFRTAWRLTLSRKPHEAIERLLSACTLCA